MFPVVVGVLLNEFVQLGPEPDRFGLLVVAGGDARVQHRIVGGDLVLQFDHVKCVVVFGGRRRLMVVCRRRAPSPRLKRHPRQLLVQAADPGYRVFLFILAVLLQQ